MSTRASSVDPAGQTVLNKLRPGDTIDLDNLISYDALFDAYSEEFYDATNLTFRTPNTLGDLKVEIVDGDAIDSYAGQYIASEDKIAISSDYLDDPDRFMAILMHEVQHAVQRREGFISGSNTEVLIENAANQVSPGVASRPLNAREFNDRREALRTNTPLDYNESLSTIDKYLDYDELDKLSSDLENLATQVDPTIAGRFDLEGTFRDYIKYVANKLDTGSHIEPSVGSKIDSSRQPYDKRQSYTMFDFVLDPSELRKDYIDQANSLGEDVADDFFLDTIEKDVQRFEMLNEALQSAASSSGIF